jgi:hypothetical protein
MANELILATRERLERILKADQRSAVIKNREAVARLLFGTKTVPVFLLSAEEIAASKPKN